MRICCVICGDICVPADELSSTPCGHTFHSLCIIQWLERSKSCPQCRHKATEKSLVKLYFDSGGSDDQPSDPDTLQQIIDGLKFQVRLKDQEVSKVKESNSVLSKHNKGLKEECKSLEKQVRDKESTNLAFRSQLKYMAQYRNDAQQAKETAQKLRSQLTNLQNVEKILSGTSHDVENMLTSYENEPENVRSLATFCSLLKKELAKASDDKKKYRDEAASLRTKLKELRQDYHKAVNQSDLNNEVKKTLQDDVMSLESENRSLKKKIDALQQSVLSPSGDVKNSIIHRLIAESPAPRLEDMLNEDLRMQSSMAETPTPTDLRRPHDSISDDDDVVAITPEVIRKVPRVEKTLGQSIEFLGTTGSSSGRDVEMVSSKSKKKFVYLPGRQPLAVTTNVSKTSHVNIFAKKRPPVINLIKNPQPCSSSQIGYDGLGGHHKVDEFPKPRINLMPKKTEVMPKKTGVTFVTKGKSGGTVQRTTLKDFFKNTFDDDF